MSEQEKYEKATRDAGFEPFQTISEHWGIYALKDGSYLKLRANVIKIGRAIDNFGNIAFNVNANTTIGIIPPRNLKGGPHPKPPTPQELVASIVDDDVGLITVEEEWSTYRLQDGTVLSIKLIPIKVSRTSIHDLNGEPLYNVDNQLLTKASVPEELRRKGVHVQPQIPGKNPSFIT